MDGVRGQGPDAEHRGVEVRARAQVRDGAQELRRVALLLQGVVRRAGALHGELVRLDLKGLLVAGRQLQHARDPHGRAHVELDRVLEVGQAPLHEHDLQVLKERAVVELDKAKGLAVAHGAHPAVYRHDAPIGRGLPVERANRRLFHGFSPPQKVRAVPSIPRLFPKYYCDSARGEAESARSQGSSRFRSARTLHCQRHSPAKSRRYIPRRRRSACRSRGRE